MMDTSSYTPFLGIAGYLPAKWILDRFSITNRILRIAVLITVPVVTAGSIVAVPRLVDAYVARHSASYARSRFEDTMFKEYPSFKVIAEQEPALWEKVSADMVRTYQAHGNQMDTEVAQQMAASFRPLNDRLKKVSAAADDDHVLKWLAVESALVNHLMQESPVLCAGHLLGTSFGQPEPSQLTISLQRKVQAAMMDAYDNGLRTQAKIPAEEDGVVLFRKAIWLPTNSLSDPEVAILQN